MMTDHWVDRPDKSISFLLCIFAFQSICYFSGIFQPLIEINVSILIFVILVVYFLFSNDIWAGAQHFLQDCMCAKRRLRSACSPEQSGPRPLHQSMDSQGFKASSGGQCWLWSACASAHVDLSLFRVHMLYCWKYLPPAQFASLGIISLYYVFWLVYVLNFSTL